MSVPAGQANRYVYAGDGSSTSFAVNSVFETSADLLVYTWDTVNKVAALKVLNTDYTVSGGNDSTGTVVFGSAPASTLQVVIVVAPTVSQTQAITTGGVLPPAQYLYGLDFLTLIARRLNELFTRSISKQDYDTSTFDPRLPTSMSPGDMLALNSGGTGFTGGFPSAASRANMLLGFDSAGLPIAAAGPASKILPAYTADASYPSPVAGSAYYNTTTATIRVYNGSSWIGVSQVIPAYSADASYPTPVTGSTFFNTTLQSVRVYNGTAWAGVGGGVAGPGTSTTNGVATYAGTNGQTLVDSVSQNIAYVPCGHDATSTPGLAFAGTGDSGAPIPAKTGFAADCVTGGNVTFLDFFLQGRQLLSIVDVSSDRTASYITCLANLRPDTSTSTTVGRAQNAFPKIFGTFLMFGDTINGKDETRKTWIRSSDASGNGTADRGGIGFDNANWNEWYFNAYDNAVGAFYDSLSIKLDSRVVTVTPPANATADANPALTVTLKGSDKSAGTGNGGDLVLANSTSAGGVKGHVYLPAVSVDPSETPASYTGQVPVQYHAARNKFMVYNGGAWQTPVTGPKNYIQYSDFENNAITGWSLAHTTLSSLVPNQASGSWTAASGSLAFSAVSSGALAGTYSGKLAWTGTTSVPGDMLVSQAYTIDLEDQAKVLTFKAYYSATVGASLLNFSGTSANTYQVYIYDVANSAWIQPAGVYGMTQGSGVGYVTGTFQAPSNMTQFRIALVCVNASASGSHTILLDDVSVSPNTAPLGVPATDLTAYSYTLAGSTSNPTIGTVSLNKLAWARDADSMVIQFQFKQTAAGSAGSGTYLIPLPAGYSIDTTKCAIDTSGFGSAVGIGQVQYSGFNGSAAYIIAYSATQLAVIFDVGASAESAGFWGSGSGSISTVGSVNVSFTARVPIAGWSSNVQMSNDTDTRVVAANMYLSGTQTGVNTNNSAVAINLASSAYDSHGAFSSSGHTFTAPISGYYRLAGSVFVNATNVVNNVYCASFLVNGSEVARGPSINVPSAASFIAAGATEQYLTAGQTVQLALYGGGNNSASTLTIGNGQLTTWLTVSRMSGPAVVAATESIYAKYNSCATVVAASSTTVLVYTSKEFDSHSAYSVSTGLFTCPVSGVYECSGFFQASVATGSGVVNNGDSLRLQKNGSDVSYMCNFTVQQTGTAMTRQLGGTAMVKCNAGDTIGVAINNPDSQFTGVNNSTATWVSFKRIGN